MQTIFFGKVFDTTFTPNIKNLCKRNGVFYYCKQVGGKRVVKSLKTDDVFLAEHRLRQAPAVTSGQVVKSSNAIWRHYTWTNAQNGSTYLNKQSLVFSYFNF